MKEPESSSQNSPVAAVLNRQFSLLREDAQQRSKLSYGVDAALQSAANTLEKVGANLRAYRNRRILDSLPQSREARPIALAIVLKRNTKV